MKIFQKITKNPVLTKLYFSGLVEMEGLRSRPQLDIVIITLFFFYKNINADFIQKCVNINYYGNLLTFLCSFCCLCHMSARDCKQFQLLFA